MTAELRAEYAKLHTDCSTLIALAAKESRVLTGEEKTAQDARYSRMDVLKAQDEAEKKMAAYAFNTGAVNDGKSDAQREFEAIEADTKANTSTIAFDNAPMTDAQKAKFSRAANHYLRTGEVTDKFTITSTGNGILLPTSVLPPEAIRRNMNAFRALLGATGYQPLTTTGTETLVLPIFDDTGVTGDTPAENATSANTADSATTGSVSLGQTLYSSKQRWFSNTVLNANGFDILGYITPILQKSVDKKQESDWTTALAGITAPTFTNAHDGTITYAELLSWEHTLNVAYRSDAGFIVSDSLYRLLRGLADANARPIMDLDPTNVFQSRVHNRPVFVSDYLAATGTANGIAGAFLSGDAIKLRDVVPQRLVRFVNAPAYPDQTGFQLFANGDCKFVSNAVALFKLAAGA